MNFRSRIFRSARPAAFLVVLVAALAARADAGDLPAGLPAGGGTDWAWLATVFFPTVPFLAGLLAMVIALALHWMKSASVARAWQGQSPGRAAFFLMPVLVGLATYVLLVAATLATAWSSSPDFASYVRDNAGSSDVASLVAGALVVLLPLFATFVLPGRRTAPAPR